MSAGALAHDRSFTSPLLGRRERLWPTVVASLAVHAALLGFAGWHAARQPRMNLDKPIVARLVRQGELKPKELLPRKDAAPAPAAAPETAPAPTPAPAPKPAPAPAPVARAAPAPKPAAAPKAAPAAKPGSSNALASALSRIEKDEKVYGSPDGDARGDADEGEAGDQYLALVTRSLQETYVLPSTISDRERMHLRATVLLFIEPDGRVSRWSFEDRSGNAVFDAALERAVRAARLPPPPASMRDRYRSQGLAVLYRP